MNNYFDTIKNLVMISATSDSLFVDEELIWAKDLSSFSDGSLPAHEDVYILGHQVSEDFPMHSHDYFEVIYAVKGQVLNRIDNVEIYMTEGDFCFLNTKAKHQLICNDNEAFILNLCLSKNLFEGNLKGFYEDENPLADFLRGETRDHQNFMYFSASYNHEIKKVMSNMITEYKRTKFRQSYALDAYITLLLHHLTQLGEYSFFGIDQKTLEILQYIEANCLELGMSQIANNLGYHPSYFSTYIKKHTGHNYKDLVTNVRFHKATELLVESNHTIEDIASDCGYQSVSHFFKVFKERYGCTPKEYRG